MGLSSQLLASTLALGLVGCPALLSDNFRITSDAAVAGDDAATDSPSALDDAMDSAVTRPDDGGDRDSSSRIIADAAGDACAPTALRCSGTTAQACSSSGQWEPAVECPIRCEAGACIIATAVSVGGSHVCALLSTGTVECWGSNALGQLGNGTTTDSSTPVEVPNLVGVTSVSAGEDHTCALLQGGTIACWGDNVYGELGNGTLTGPDSCGGEPCSTTPAVVTNLTGATAVSVGYDFSCALLSAGTVQCWGRNGAGQLGSGNTNNSPTPALVSSLTGATAVAAGYQNACALITGGAAACWGDNEYGQLGNGTIATAPPYGSSAPVAVSNLTGATAISLGTFFSCAELPGGTVECWGDDASGEIGNGTTIGPDTCGSGAGSHGCASSPVMVSSLTGATALSTANGSTCAVLSGGTVDCWGDNSVGELGNGTTTSSATPGPVSGLTDAIAISAGGDNPSACAVLSSGTIECWGGGTLGNRSATQSATPVLVSW